MNQSGLKVLVFGVACLLALGTFQSAAYAISNPSFEFSEIDDFLTDWEYFGDVSVVTSDFGATPTQGTRQALLTTLSSSAGEEPYSGEDALDIVDFEDLLNDIGADPDDFVGQADADLYDPMQGSLIGQEFAGIGGYILCFDYNFLSDEEGEVNDFAFVFIMNEFGDFIFESIAEAIYSDFEGSSTDFSEETGYITYSYTLPQSGDYLIALGILDDEDEEVGSGLLLDNFQLKSGAPVPEPASLVLLGSGLFGLIGFKRKK